MGMFLAPLTETDILALFHPAEAATQSQQQEKVVPIVKIQCVPIVDKDIESSDTTCINDPTIDAAKFLAGKEEAPVDKEDEKKVDNFDISNESTLYMRDINIDTSESQTHHVPQESKPTEENDAKMPLVFPKPTGINSDQCEVSQSPVKLDNDKKVEDIPMTENNCVSSEKVNDNIPKQSVIINEVKELKPLTNNEKALDSSNDVTNTTLPMGTSEVDHKTEKNNQCIGTPQTTPSGENHIGAKYDKDTNYSAFSKTCEDTQSADFGLSTDVKPDAAASSNMTTDDEVDRQKLVDIIQINISKFCKTISYDCNETAQRKVKSIFNILADCKTAEDIYDTILCEGLQWFVEFHVEGEEISEEDFGDNTEGEVKRHLVPEKESIVSKILHEIATPAKIERKEKSVEMADIEGREHKGASTEPIDYSISRHKASRQVKKYVRTSNSATDSTQLIDCIDETEKIEKKTSKNENKSSTKSTVATAPGDLIEKLCNEPDKRSDDKIKEYSTPGTLTVQVSGDETACDVENSTPHVTFVKTDQEQKLTKEEQICLDVSKNRLTASPNKRLSLGAERKDSQELSIECAKRKMESQRIERSFSEALKEGKSKRRNQNRRISGSQGEESIVSRLLKEKSQADFKEENMITCGGVVPTETLHPVESIRMDSEKNHGNKDKTDKTKDTYDLQETSEAVDHIKAVRVARERTESECSDTMPDLCPIEAEKEERKRIEEMRKEIEEMKRIEKKDIGSLENRTSENKLRFSEDLITDIEADNDHEMTPLFLTNFDDDESDADISAADITEHLHSSRIGAEVVEPQVRSLIESLFSEVFDESDNSEKFKKEQFASGIEQFIGKLVSNILDLVLRLASSQESSAIECDKQRIAALERIEASEQESEDESELSECESIHDMFDLSMKRLNFIESSFKTMSSSTLDLTQSSSTLDLRSATPEQAAFTHGQEDITSNQDDRSRLEKIRHILASTEKSSEEKLKEISEIVAD